MNANASLCFSIKFVMNQNTRYGSCTSLDRTIRISERVKNMPSWVQDYIIIHELTHLLHPNHSKKFWEKVNQYKELNKINKVRRIHPIQPNLRANFKCYFIYMEKGIMSKSDSTSTTVELPFIFVELPFLIFVAITDVEDQLTAQEAEMFTRLMKQTQWCKSAILRDAFLVPTLVRHCR